MTNWAGMPPGCNALAATGLVKPLAWASASHPTGPSVRRTDPATLQSYPSAGQCVAARVNETRHSANGLLRFGVIVI